MLPKDEASIKRLNLIYDQETYQIGLSYILEYLEGHVEILLKHLRGDGSYSNPYICPIPFNLLGRITKVKAASIKYLAGVIFFDEVQNRRYQYFIKEKKTAKRTTLYLDFALESDSNDFNKLKESFTKLEQSYQTPANAPLYIQANDIYNHALEHHRLNKINPDERMRLVEGVNLVKRRDPSYKDPNLYPKQDKESIKDKVENNLLIIMMLGFLILAILGAVLIKSCSHHHSYRSSSGHYIEKDVEGGRYCGL